MCQPWQKTQSSSYSRYPQDLNNNHQNTNNPNNNTNYASPRANMHPIIPTANANANNNNYNNIHSSPNTLLDLSAKIVAQHIPFELIERRYEHVPEPVQRRIIFWSFPRSEDDIMMYSSLSSDTFSSNALTFYKGLSLYRDGAVRDVLQIGFNLNGLVSTKSAPTVPNSTSFSGPRTRAHGHGHSHNHHHHHSHNHHHHSSSSSSSSSSNNNHHHHNSGANNGNNSINSNNNNNSSSSSSNNNNNINNFSPLDHVHHNNNINNNNNNNNNNYNNNNNGNDPTNNNNNNNHHNASASSNTDPIGSNSASSAAANNNSSTDSTATKNYRVSVTFDRCKITSVSCSCEFQDIFWCEHVVALILYRIRNPETIDLRVPISETLLSLDRQQLQKLVQYIIAEHYTDVLPTAQRLLDDMRQRSSEINQIQGAPDPTAGACAEDEHIWHLDEIQVNEKVQNYLNLVCINSKDASKQITSLFKKIREMFRARDSNGTRLLKLITEQFLLNATRNEKSRPLWDQLVSLWVVVMLNPNISKPSKNHFAQLLFDWSQAPKCPKEDIERKLGLKRKAEQLSDDEDSEGYTSPAHECDYLLKFNQSNNYPAHMATHRHRTFQSNNGPLPVLKPYNQLPFMPPSCPCQMPHPIGKKIKTHSLQHCGSSHGPFNQVDAPSTSSNHQPGPRNMMAAEPSNSNSNSNPNQNQNRPTGPIEPRSVFHLALDFKECSWNSPHLQLILNKDGPINFNVPQRSSLFDSSGYPLWTESIPQAAARIETLRSHGYRTQALRLAVASVRHLKVLQDQWYYSATEQLADAPCMFRGLTATLTDGWIGHFLDPINVMVELLLDASLTEVNNSTNSGSSTRDPCTNSYRCSCPYNQALADFTHRMMPTFLSAYKPRMDGFPLLPLVSLTPPSRRPPTASSQSHSDKSTYNHVPVPGCCQKDSYLTLAFELALMALGQQRSLPTTATAHDRAVRQESDLIAKLESIDTTKDHILVDILRYQSTLLIEGGPFHNACCRAPADSAPIHTFCRYLFESLVPHCPHLAYKIGVYALKMPLSIDENVENVGAARTTPRGINYNHLQSEQLSLAQTMLSKAKDEMSPQGGGFLRKVYRASIKNIRSPASLLKLSKHALKEAKPNGNTLYPLLLKTSFDLGLQVLKMTLSPHTSNGKTRREAVIFIIECATDMGIEAVSQLMRDAREYFSAIEALNLVVTRDNDYVNLRAKASSKLKVREREEDLHARYRELVLDCASRDPTNCALDALRFCENHHESLKRGLKIVIEAGTSGTMDSTQLIKVADWISCINGRGGWVEKAFQIAMVAVDSLSIPYNSDNSSSKKDIISACEYAQKVHGGFGLLIPKLLENIECAIVLSEIYHRFHPTTIPPPRFRNYLMGGCKPIVGLTAYNEDVRCWDLLLKRTLERFINTTRTRLQNISPRHYAEFIEFLAKAQETFEKADNGPQQFKDLISEIMKSYRTKKKLMEKLKSRFDQSRRNCPEISLM